MYLARQNYVSAVFACLLIGVVSNATAEYTGPGAVKALSTVADVLKAPKDDREVVMRGKLLKKLSSDKYLFSDGTGEIRVEIDKDDFPKQKISEATTIEIAGEVEKDFLESPEIDVERLTVAD